MITHLRMHKISYLYQVSDFSDTKQTVSSIIASCKNQYETIKSDCSSQLSQAKPQLVQELTNVFNTITPYKGWSISG